MEKTGPWRKGGSGPQEVNGGIIHEIVTPRIMTEVMLAA